MNVTVKGHSRPRHDRDPIFYSDLIWSMTLQKSKKKRRRNKWSESIIIVDSEGILVVQISPAPPFGHHQNDQEAQVCPPSGDFEDFWCLDGFFLTITSHMIPFWNP